MAQQLRHRDGTFAPSMAKFVAAQREQSRVRNEGLLARLMGRTLDDINRQRLAQAISASERATRAGDQEGMAAAEERINELLAEGEAEVEE